LAIAVAMSSVNWPMRASVSGGSASSRVLAAIIAPHSRPSTKFGVPTAERTPPALTRAPIAPLASP
jgi:hypothetical protein